VRTRNRLKAGREDPAQGGFGNAADSLAIEEEIDPI